VQFVSTPLSDAHLATRDEKGEVVLYVRLSAPLSQRRVGVLARATTEVQRAMRLADQQGAPVDRVVVVGADRMVTAADADGRDEALQSLADLLTELAAAQVSVTWRTRAGIQGPVPAPLAEAFDAAQHHLTVEVGIPTLDRTMCRALEGPSAQDPKQRLRLASAASSRGVMTVALVDPLVPMLTDQASALNDLFEACADAGMHQVRVRYLVMTRGRAKRLAASLSSMHRALIRGVFADEEWRAPHPSGLGPQEAHKLLPSKLRKAGHHRVHLEADKHGLLVSVLDPVDEDAPVATTKRVSRPPKSPSKVPTGSMAPRPQLDLFSKSA